MRLSRAHRAFLELEHEILKLFCKEVIRITFQFVQFGSICPILLLVKMNKYRPSLDVFVLSSSESREPRPSSRSVLERMPMSTRTKALLDSSRGGGEFEQPFATTTIKCES